ncbi:MAG TPA: YdeI/OmpD-associated family protein [Sphingomonas sp.]|nr:YdeI/OmpD-associated family protein [Sphingomonas sp.]
MASTDPRIDAYIDCQAPFARPILSHLRAAVHRACPDVAETLRWQMPAFTYKGQILCQMAAFKAHAVFGFWRSREVTGEVESRSAMGQFGRLTSLADLPDDAALDAMIRKAVALIDSGTKAPRPLKHPKPELALPDDLREALAANPAAQAVYEAFPPGQKREYCDWVAEAKRPETRAKRVAQAVEWMAEGKRRNWQYERC